LQQVRAEMDHYYIGMMNVVDVRLLTINTPDAPVEEEEEPSGPVEGRDTTPSPTPEEKIVHFVKSLNTCIARYHALLKVRRTRKEKDEDENVTEEME
jgi:hypothetical protein